MLTSDFNQELGSLIRSLERKVQQDPKLAALPTSTYSGGRDAVDKIEEAIISLIALHIQLTRRDT